MVREFPEADWKALRKVREVALERFCERILDQVVRASADSSQSFHERYLSIWRLLQKHDKQLGDAFNNPRRSQAFVQLLAMCSLGIIEEQELQKFTAATQEFVKMLMGTVIHRLCADFSHSGPGEALFDSIELS